MKTDNTMTPLQAHFVTALLEGRREISEFEAAERCRALGIRDIQFPCVVVCVAPYYTQIEYGIKDKTISDVESFVLHYLRSKGYICCGVVNAYDNVQIILHSKVDDSLEERFIRLHDKIQLRFGVELFIGIGSEVDEYTQLSVSAHEATEMLAYKYQYADRGVINISNMIRFRHNTSYASDEPLERVLGCFQDGDLGRMSTRLDELVEEVRWRPNVSKTSIRRTMVELTVSILHIASSADVDVDAVIGDDDPYHWIMTQEHTEVITEWIMKLAFDLRTQMNEQQKSREKRVILDACAHIAANLDDPGLGLQSISDWIGLTAPYFSQLFKKEMNIGISNYITAQRIDKATALLQSSDLTIDEIARQVGFARANYFSSVFKKMTGFTPGEYRKQQKRLADRA